MRQVVSGRSWTALKNDEGKIPTPKQLQQYKCQAYTVLRRKNGEKKNTCEGGLDGLI